MLMRYIEILERQEGVMVASLDSEHSNFNPRCITISARRNNKLGINGRTSVTVLRDGL